METIEISSELDINNHIPLVFALPTPHPNPFNPTTMINFSVPHYNGVSIDVYDIAGRLLTTLADSYYHPGNYQISWDASEYSSGVYFVKMKSADFIETQKIMLIK